MTEQLVGLLRLMRFAPGDYLCKCEYCGSTFDGDKRATTCKPCALEHVSVLGREAEAVRAALTKSAA